MRPRRIRSRLTLLVLVVALLGAPAVILRALCAGRSCEEAESAASEVPFCSLPDRLRTQIAAGFEGDQNRSPDVLMVTAADAVSGGTVYGGTQPPWPSVEDGPARVPLVFSGRGVDPEASLPGAVDLADVAPTVAEMIGLRRPNPQVRAGTPISGVASGERPRLVLLVALKGVGSEDVEASSGRWRTLRRLIDKGTGSLDATTGSLPVDPAATMTTLGTGGLPTQHGITATVVRNDAGEVVRAWGRRSPINIIATLGDDLDEILGQKPKIGLVGTATEDRGLIGGEWYIDVDEDEVAIGGRDPVPAVERVLARGFGDDAVPDLLAVALEGTPREVDRDLGRVVALADSGSPGEVGIVVAGTGHAERSRVETGAFSDRLEQRVPGPTEVVDEVVAGGLFLDQDALVSSGVTEDDVVRALDGLRVGGPDPLLSDAFEGIAVSFARYC